MFEIKAMIKEALSSVETRFVYRSVPFEKFLQVREHSLARKGTTTREALGASISSSVKKFE